MNTQLFSSKKQLPLICLRNGFKCLFLVEWRNKRIHETERNYFANVFESSLFKSDQRIYFPDKNIYLTEKKNIYIFTQ